MLSITGLRFLHRKSFVACRLGAHSRSVNAIVSNDFFVLLFFLSCLVFFISFVLQALNNPLGVVVAWIVSCFFNDINIEICFKFHWLSANKPKKREATKKTTMISNWMICTGNQIVFSWTRRKTTQNITNWHSQSVCECVCELVWFTAIVLFVLLLYLFHLSKHSIRNAIPGNYSS